MVQMNAHSILILKKKLIISHRFPINPLSPHDALKHYFTFLKTDLIFLQQRVLEWKGLMR